MSNFQNLLSGALYGTLKGTFFCCILTATGASMCYLLSFLSGADIILRTWPERMRDLRAQVTEVSFFLVDKESRNY